MGDRTFNDANIVIAVYSVLLIKIIDDSMYLACFTNIHIFGNGKEAWDYLSSIKDEPDLYEKVKLIITDIEMPQMDGHRLTKLIKDDSRLKKIPVIIFSSLIDDQMRRKGKELGADDQLAKPEIGRLVAMMDKLLKEYEETRAKARG